MLGSQIGRERMERGAGKENGEREIVRERERKRVSANFISELGQNTGCMAIEDQIE